MAEHRDERAGVPVPAHTFGTRPAGGSSPRTPCPARPVPPDLAGDDGASEGTALVVPASQAQTSRIRHAGRSTITPRAAGTGGDGQRLAVSGGRAVRLALDRTRNRLTRGLHFCALPGVGSNISSSRAGPRLPFRRTGCGGGW